MTSSSKNRSIAFAPFPTLSAPARLSGSNLIQYAGIDHVNRFIKSVRSSGGRGGAKVTGMSEESTVTSALSAIARLTTGLQIVQIHSGRSGQLSSTLFISSIPLKRIESYSTINQLDQSCRRTLTVIHPTFLNYPC